ncbi:hypothetical protein M431DRAFT_488643 [Trichoderma harzianum CBS 226.95]|uniref:Uncharacterized protein n=1 Tax=Trichoderma harzianum CBS 226.95 TaxID=983964 RepID=A0A2T3ZR98_TRIHA|nr:hypothetical protein M431DRAFT_488643 [Trichoderma harzianum CBS 226.95]PTB47326.1 hypothetical protein M431DRAFT_488643 [Trichoderma harzianum CBS 226.95]
MGSLEKKEYTYASLEGDQTLPADVYHASSSSGKPGDVKPNAIIFYGGRFMIGTEDIETRNSKGLMTLGWLTDLLLGELHHDFILANVTDPSGYLIEEGAVVQNRVVVTLESKRTNCKRPDDRIHSISG